MASNSNNIPQINISSGKKRAENPNLTVQAQLLYETPPPPGMNSFGGQSPSIEISIASPSAKGKKVFLAHACGISVVRPEIIGKIEFIPLVTNPNSNPIVTNNEWTLGNSTEQISITSAARLLEMQTISHNFIDAKYS